MMVTSGVVAQQMPLLDLYHQNRILINPANTGDFGNWSAFVDSRNQWSGINGAPKTRTFGVHGLINSKMGVGGIVMSDRCGLIDRLSINFNYAYIVKLNSDHQLTFALNAILNENQFLMSNAVVKDMNDNILSLQSFEGTRFDAGFGMRYNWNKLEFGLAIPYLFQSKVRYFTSENNEYIFDFYRHWLGYISYRFNFGDDWAVEPFLMYRDARYSPSQMDLNVTTKWRDKYWLGLGYRNSGRTWVETGSGGEYTQINLSLANSYFLLSGGITLMNNIDLAYAYEVSNSAIYNRSHGSHEMMLIYTFGGGKKAKNYDDEIELIKKNQLSLQNKMDTVIAKVDGNINATNSLSEKTAVQEKKIDDLSKDIEGLRKDIANLPSVPQSGEVTVTNTDGKATQVVEKVTVVTTSGSGLNSVYFKSGSYNLTYEAKLELMKFIATAKDATNKIEITGYADDVGEKELNMILSQKRAQEVLNYLLKNGIVKERISIQYYGEDKPMVPNSSIEGRSLNRRVDVFMVK